MSILSNNFRNAFNSGFGSCRQICDCGIQHYDYANEYDWEDGELESLIADNEAIGHDGGFDILCISGADIVADCACGKAEVAESWIIRNQTETAHYLRLYQKDLISQAKALEV